ncbi:acylphosphatase [Saccharospirillum mangrovi]|uniref:acylphosphatase n=1 Tax=Saccharospirillum mangrovi TaxID=2161747 RepID=UPI002795E7B8|nr:acylphosphatase [Saccharospirillum mangrovi]
MQCMKAWVYGKVQGVGYRLFCRRRARELGVTGHAINLPDGRVEVLLCGTEDALSSMIDALHQGPHFAQVAGVDVERIALGGAEVPTDFVTG